MAPATDSTVGALTSVSPENIATVSQAINNIISTTAPITTQMFLGLFFLESFIILVNWLKSYFIVKR